ncbi:MAG: hypothetical protein H7X99_03585 [Saprospiraceae bacterium]|nr:hypothetical protein [Saprospiraceae bacterium]
MKSLRLLLGKIAIILAITSVTGFSAAIEKKSEVVQIKDLLNSIDFRRFSELPLDVRISFIINGKNELIVVGTNNKSIDHVIKSALNYKKISVSELLYEKIYTVPVKINV